VLENPSYSAASSMEELDHGAVSRWLWFIVFMSITLILLFAGYAYYRHETERIRQQKYDDIAAIACLKTVHVQQWRKSLINDVRALSTGPFFKRGVDEWLRNPSDNALRNELHDRLVVGQEQGGYVDALVLDKDGKVVLSASASPQPLDVQEEKAIQEGTAALSPRLSLVYRSAQGAILMSAVAPIMNKDGAIIAVALYRSNLESEFLPFIQTWPTPSETAETLLVRKEGDEVLFINNLRHQLAAALSLRDPLTREDRPAVKAVLGKRGMFQGKDYRGHEVLADLSHIPDSPWFMVAKVDTSEILQEAQYRGSILVIFSVMFILLAASVTAFWYRHRRAGFYKRMYRAERQQRASQEEFRTILYSIGDAVITTDTGSLVKRMNPVAEHLTGWKEPEARGKPLEEVFHIINEDSRMPIENPVSRILSDGMVIGLANHTVLISKNGTEYAIADSGAPIRDEEGDVIGVALVFRDQTAERKSQRALEEKEQLLRETGRMARVGGWEVDADSLEVRWTEETYRIHEVPLDYKPPLEEAINFFHEDDRAMLKQAIQNALQQGEPYDMEIRCATATGKQLWTRTICQPEIENGKTVKLRGTFQDISERKAAEESVLNSERFLQATLDALSSHIAILDEKGFIVSVNESWRRFGKDNGAGFLRDGIGLNYLAICDSAKGDWSDGASAVAGMIRKIIGGESEDFAWEYPCHSPSEKRWFVLHATRFLMGSLVRVVLSHENITERKEAEEALRESEERYRRIVDTSTEGIWAMDGEFRTTFANEQMAAILGYRIDEMLGKSVDSFMFDEDLGDHNEKMEARRRGENQTYERRFQRKDGSALWTIVSANTLKDPNGNFAGSFAMFTDITSRKHAEEALSTSEAQLANALDMARLGHWELDVLKNEFTFNDQFYKLFRTTAEQVGGYKMALEEYARRFVHPDEISVVSDENRKAIETADPHFSRELEHRIVYADGDIGHISVRFFIVKDEQGRTVRTYGVNQDITERKKAEEALRESEERLRLAWETVSGAIAITRLEDGTYVDVNKGFTVLSGYDKEEVIGKSSVDIPIWHDQASRHRYISCLLTDGHVKNLETKMRRRDGQLRTVLMSGTQFTLNGQPHLLSVGTDVEELYQAEQALRESEANFRSFFEALDDLVLVATPEGRCLFVNDAVTRKLGYGKDDLLGRHILELHPSDLRKDAETIFCQMLTGKRATCTLEIQAKNGERLPVENRIATGKWNGSDCLFGVCKDLSKERAALERFTRVFNSNPALMALSCMPERRLTEVNDRFVEVLGYSRDELLGRTAKQTGIFVNPATAQEITDAIEREGGVRNLEVQARRKDGTIVEGLFSGEVIESFGEKQFLSIMLDVTETKRTQEALRESEERYRAVFDNAGIGIDVLDRNGRILRVNRALQDMLGYTEEELRGTTFLNITHSEDIEISESRYEALSKGEIGSYRIEKRYLRKDGSTLWVDLTTSAMYGPRSEPIGMIGVISDITSRKQADIELQESEERYRTVADFTYDWESWINPEGELVYVSPSCERMTGYASKEFLDDPELLERIVHPDDRPGALSHFQRARKGEYDLVHKMDFRLVRRDGQTRWIGHTCQPVWGKDGQPLGRRASNRDITDRRQAETALAESELRFRSIFEHARDAIMMVDLEGDNFGRIVSANPVAAQIHGYSLEEFQNLKLEDLETPDSVKGLQARLQAGLSGESVRDEIEHRRKDGSVFPLEISASLLDISGHKYGIGIDRDITDRKLLETQLAQAQKMEAVGTLAGGVAHDFNNVLQVALGYSEIILDDEEFPEHHKADLQKIHESAKRGADLVQRLLTFSRKTEINLQPLDLNSLITDLQKMLERTLPKMVGIQLVLDAKLAKINADKTQMDQVLMNLAVNARDAMPDGGKLLFETVNVMIDEEYARTHLEAHPGPHVLLMVTDTGSGMDKDTLEHIFEPFYTTKGVGEGTGLGLAMVHGIVKQHGGHINCYSEPGKGTTFKIYFPAMESEGETDAETTSIMPAFGTETVLLVDDEEFVRELGARILSKHGYTVLQAVNGKEALNVFEKERSSISLVILDLIMPEMGGTECLKELLKIDPNVKVLVASGYSADASVKRTIGTAAKGFVNKPFRVNELLRDVRRVLDES
jgi:two-component system, cell cycle sensor histidine kinase and response regulator CckA